MVSVYQRLKSILGLSLSLAKAYFKSRNEGSFLGIFWYLLEPLLLFVIIILIRTSFGIGNIEFYGLYLLLGLVMINFFTGTTSSGVTSITNNVNYIKSMTIPKESLVVSQVLMRVYSHLFEMVMFFVFMIIFGAPLLNILFYPFVFLFYVIFITGVSFILSVLGVYMMDFRNVWTVFTRFLFFATPVFYVVQEGTLIFKLSQWNPIYHFINISRGLVIYNQIPGIKSFLVIISVSLGVFIIGILIFNKSKDKFAELI